MAVTIDVLLWILIGLIVYFLYVWRSSRRRL